MDFSTRLKELLRDRQLLQKDFATAINIAPSTVGNYTQGTREPDFETLKRIASYFHVSLDYLLGNEINSVESEAENELLQLYRILDDKQKAFLLEQAKFLVGRQI